MLSFQASSSELCERGERKGDHSDTTRKVEVYRWQLDGSFDCFFIEKCPKLKCSFNGSFAVCQILP